MIFENVLHEFFQSNVSYSLFSCQWNSTCWTSINLFAAGFTKNMTTFTLKDFLRRLHYIQANRTIKLFKTFKIKVKSYHKILYTYLFLPFEDFSLGQIRTMV